MITYVIKAGGSYFGSVDTPEALEKCKALSKQLCELGRRANVAVVTSAFAKHTDKLLELAAWVYGIPADDLEQSPEVDEILIQGELYVAKLLNSYIRASGGVGRFIDPHSPTFPIHADSAGNVNLNQSYDEVKKIYQDCRKRGEILIVPGFVAQTDKGIMTLGRNSSDYSAAIVGMGIGADIIYKLGAVAGISDGNGGYIREVNVQDLLSKEWKNGCGYKKFDCIFDPRGLRILEPPTSILVTNDINNHGTLIYSG